MTQLYKPELVCRPEPRPHCAPPWTPALTRSIAAFRGRPTHAIFPA